MHLIYQLTYIYRIGRYYIYINYKQYSSSLTENRFQTPYSDVNHFLVCNHNG